MSNDFDFLLGNWKVVNTRLKDWLCDSKIWIEFESEHTEKRLEDGNGNFAFHQYTRQGSIIERSVLRLYDEQSQYWKINRVDSWSDLLIPSLHGTFWQNKGSFLSKGIFHGIDVLVWVEWTKICKTYACWEQALSSDNGRTWETNWQMEFFRR